MPCTEFVNAIDWSKTGTSDEQHPVTAYFTKHFGTAGSTPATTQLKDAVHYASGEVWAVDTPKLHLKGTLQVATNTDQPGVMVTDSKRTYDVEIYPDGALSYLMKVDGKVPFNVPPTKVQATCLNNVLLAATTGSEAVAVGVARKPAKPGPPK